VVASAVEGGEAALDADLDLELVGDGFDVGRQFWVA